MNTFYTAERNAQILIQLMKEHGVKKIIASPGSTNVCFVASVQQDPYFEIYSSIDERSAAYLACGLAAETGEAVAISCTGATASRNYMPGLTEAYYRHLPVLAITSTQSIERIGQNIPQVLDRRVIPSDIAYLSVHLPAVHDKETEWSCIVKVNNALLELKRNGGGSVHIDLTTEYSADFSVKKLPIIRKIERILIGNKFPELQNGKIAVFVGAHTKWSDKLTTAVERFCENNNAVVLCDQTSNYWGKYKILPNILCSQAHYTAKCRYIDTLIHIGEISGCYLSIFPQKVWRVHVDGELKDTFKGLTYVFQMNEIEFFEHYANANTQEETSYFEEWKQECDRIEAIIPELPFSNVWVAQRLATQIPSGSVIHLGILNSLRSWNYFTITKGVNCYCNVGGFGIDGGVSSLIGASLADKNKLFFGIVGDLAFFYDMNAIGNRHISNNIRLIIINNGRGTEFRNNISWASMFGENTDKYIAAAGHFGYQSSTLVKHYAEDLGFKYLSASNKKEFEANVDKFVTPDSLLQPIVFEIFTDSKEENEAIELVITAEKNTSSVAKSLVKGIIGNKGTTVLKNIIKS